MIFSNFLYSNESGSSAKRNYKRRSQGKGEISYQKRVLICYLNPSPADSATRNCRKPHPSGARLADSICLDFFSAGPNCTVCLIGDVGRNWNRVLFCFEETENRPHIIPNDTARRSLSKISTLFPRVPHLAGTQTALPSVPEPMQGSFAAEPTSHSRCRAFLYQENDSLLSQTAPINIPLSKNIRIPQRSSPLWN